jgi:hypothetical protein
MAFKKGQSGNPLGRRPGSKNKLTENFWTDFSTVWSEGGIDAIRKVKTEDPSTFVRVAASLMPKETETTIRTVRAEQLGDDELASIAAGSGADATEAPLDPSQLN